MLRISNFVYADKHRNNYSKLIASVAAEMLNAPLQDAKLKPFALPAAVARLLKPLLSNSGQVIHDQSMDVGAVFLVADLIQFSQVGDLSQTFRDYHISDLSKYKETQDVYWVTIKAAAKAFAMHDTNREVEGIISGDSGDAYRNYTANDFSEILKDADKVLQLYTALNKVEIGGAHDHVCVPETHQAALAHVIQGLAAHCSVNSVSLETMQSSGFARLAEQIVAYNTQSLLKSLSPFVEVTPAQTARNDNVTAPNEDEDEPSL